jgi:S-adenosylmethionine:tRNA ribosyltransferase-isomerase
MIAPGFTWRVVDGIVTNFHQPHSTLLLLVASFLGRNGKIDEWRNIYEEALKNDYRFLSYGDGSLLL